jgi:hypothetical protein
MAFANTHQNAALTMLNGNISYPLMKTKNGCIYVSKFSIILVTYRLDRLIVLASCCKYFCIDGHTLDTWPGNNNDSKLADG